MDQWTDLPDLPDPEADALLTLPAVLLAPLPELAAAARANQLLRDTCRLAEWAQGRKVTRAGRLSLPEARKAVTQLGLPGDQGPGRTPARTAADFPELTELWDYAVGAELIYAQSPAAVPGQGLGELRRDEDRDVCEIWAAFLDTALDRWFETPPLDLGLIPAMLAIYLQPAGVTVDDIIVDAIEQHLESFKPELREVAARNLAEVADPILRELLGSLTALGALEVEGDEVRVTPLGTFGLCQWFESLGLEAPSVDSLSEATAMQLLELGRDLKGPDELQAFFADWVSARGEQVASQELALLARAGDRGQRSTAFVLLDQIGDVAGPVVRRLLDEPLLRPQAVAWLSMRGLEGPEPTPAEIQWATVEALVDLLELEPTQLGAVLGAVTAESARGEVAIMLEQLGFSDHPQTVEVLELLAEHHPDPAAARAARKAALRARSSR